MRQNKESRNENERFKTESFAPLDPFKHSSTHSASPLRQTLMHDESDESHSLMQSYTSSAHCLSHCSFEFEFLENVYSNFTVICEVQIIVLTVQMALVY